jgi:hypothetical protein
MFAELNIPGTIKKKFFVEFVVPSLPKLLMKRCLPKPNQTSSRRTAQVKRPVFWNLGQILVDLNLAHAPFFWNWSEISSLGQK